MHAMLLRFSCCIPVLILKSQRHNFSQTNNFSEIVKFGVQTVYHCSVTHRCISRLLADVHCTQKLTNRLYTTVLLPTGPLPNWILLFYYPHADCQTVYYCSFTDVPSTKLYTTVPLPSGPLTDCIPLSYYIQAHDQTELFSYPLPDC